MEVPNSCEKTCGKHEPFRKKMQTRNRGMVSIHPGEEVITWPRWNVTGKIRAALADMHTPWNCVRRPCASWRICCFKSTAVCIGSCTNDPQTHLGGKIVAGFWESLKKKQDFEKTRKSVPVCISSKTQGVILIIRLNTVCRDWTTHTNNAISDTLTH